MNYDPKTVIAMRSLLVRAKVFIRDDRDSLFDGEQVGGVITDATNWAVREMIEERTDWLSKVDEVLAKAMVE